MSLKLPLPRAIFVHGFLTINGQKISKSLGNVIDPFYLIKKYNSECLRYYLIKEIPTFNDGDFSEEKLIQRYNTELADGLGNLVSRLFALSSAYKEGFILKPTKNELIEKSKKIIAKYQEKMENYALEEAISILWQLVKESNRYLNSEKPWAKNEGEKKKILTNSLGLLFLTLKWLSPVLPSSTEKIFAHCHLSLKNEKEWFNKTIKINKIEPIFPKIT
jgi:methionyl-tRNA synthetase